MTPWVSAKQAGMSPAVGEGLVGVGFVLLDSLFIFGDWVGEKKRGQVMYICLRIREERGFMGNSVRRVSTRVGSKPIWANAASLKSNSAKLEFRLEFPRVYT